ncbi:response regulator [bacterium (Candidatus Blackallbacteria) CG17_big_fil_post_rev_8_21_14_2_50_48_46]|uniref:Response regulator n=1 Tax=bacterium (Candidatus Blackallbacteria) CG17_big_fil_post_rev_8_21_14_2_50_48_46 TaxID=2014261 RepID=A0A2M7G2J4_9BACT|nr:MAG: response regulator [bacterium (Candidatus Blackallbacteria) CG18_big_fil_WC_8_21_14_2_50_49_26]PIW16013.1 MAG: response regulator [bacterium (Candidatus Blackallbacteria) CG17_big_fil_post_rev_8_21_14_2_50_48_46]PIW50425.1 MAG: response regulator [bacterium (Candidatus Blackallbacteria) CG13_big_fil_rev_8_21_14_2_50_49_14]
MSKIRKILYIDDNQSYLRLVIDLMEDTVVEVLTASDPHEGLRMAMVTPHLDLVLLDIDMPGLTGVDILSQLRGLKRTSQFPVIMLSARQDLATIKEIQSWGVRDYLLKPFPLSDLIQRIQFYLGRDIFERSLYA